MYQVEYTPRAIKALRSLPANWRTRIVDKIDALALNPFAPNNNVTKLRGREGYRLRVGDWRILYDLDEGKIILLVIDIGARGGVYDKH
ncbi:MAG: type II toxin-antitoxin system RelE/ParE family toxin [Alphaproteobacteria bacterium]|nr:type II toxin-antitoxin system RelE/ParE family toxin [Alphaproteobacteria bacterium]